MFIPDHGNSPLFVRLIHSFRVYPKNKDFLPYFKGPEKKALTKTVSQRCVSEEARNSRCSVNEIGEMPRSGSAHDVLMETLCRFLKQAEHSMGQSFKYGLSASI